MARKQFWIDLDLMGNNLVNVVIDPLDSAPEHKAGRIYYNSTINKMMVSDGTEWSKLGSVSAAANVGTGSGIWKATEDDVIKLKSILGSPYVTITSATDTLIINVNTENAVSGLASKIPTSVAVKTYADSKISKNDIDTVCTANSDIKVPSVTAMRDRISAAVMAASAGVMQYMGVFDGSKTIAGNGITRIKPGQFWKVSVAGVASGITSPSASGNTLSVGDMIIANVDRMTPITGSDFSVIDNTEAADLVRLDTEQVLHNKTIRAYHAFDAPLINGDNIIENLDLRDFNPDMVYSYWPLADITASQKMFWGSVLDLKGVCFLVNELYNKIKAKMANDLVFYRKSFSGVTTGTIIMPEHRIGSGSIQSIQAFSRINNTFIPTEIDFKISIQDGKITWNSDISFTGDVVLVGWNGMPMQ